MGGVHFFMEVPGLCAQACVCSVGDGSDKINGKAKRRDLAEYVKYQVEQKAGRK